MKLKMLKQTVCILEEQLNIKDFVCNLISYIFSIQDSFESAA